MTDPTPDTSRPIAAYGSDPEAFADRVERDFGALAGRRFRRWAALRRLSDAAADAIAPAADLPADPHGLQARHDLLARIPDENRAFAADVAALRADPAMLERLADDVAARLGDDPDGPDAADLRRQLVMLDWLAEGVGNDE